MKNITRSSLNEPETHVSNIAGVHEHFVEPGNVSSLVGTRGKTPKVLALLKYFKLENS